MKIKSILAATVLTLAAGPVFAGKSDVINNYADIAHAAYEDSLLTAMNLKHVISEFTANPSASLLESAKAAYLSSRVPYQQTEVFRFGNPIVDDWEGKVNAWPLDEGLIDYVDNSYGGASDENPYAVLNVVANSSFSLSGKNIDASSITPALLENELHEADEVESNVATGYHAIEFLLWGQDLNGHGSGAGNRSWTDYALDGDCTNGNCDRRAEYLTAAVDLLVSDLTWITDQWTANGDARSNLLNDEDSGINAILTGMGSLSYGEQAGERMKLGLMLNDPEEEHDCFSDNTHNSHFYDGLGIRNVYFGEYVRVNGDLVSGLSLSSLVAESSADVDAALRSDLNDTVIKLGLMKAAAEAGFKYDQMLERGNTAGERLIMDAVNALVQQTRSIERAVSALGIDAIEFEGSDSLDNPSAVFN